MGTLGKITRRTFLVASAAIAGGVVFGVYKYKQALTNPLTENGENGAAGEGAYSFNPYIKIDQQGVTIITPKAEMGQGVQSLFAMLAAEELDVDWKNIRTEHGPASNTYYNTVLLHGMAGFHDYDQSEKAQQRRQWTEIPAKFFGIQITGGSTSTPDGFVKMRSAGASARMVLTVAAARRWQVEAATLKTDNGYVHNPTSGEKLSYSELAELASTIEPPADPPLRDPSQWRYLGKSMPRLDIPAKSTGTAEYAVDVRLPDMLYATVRMSPHFGVGIKQADTSKAEAMRGVKQIIRLDNDGFAVMADNSWRAFQAAAAIEVTWDVPAQAEDVWPQLEAAFSSEPNGEFDVEGDVERIFADAGDIVQAEYRVPYLAHATMEPMSAVAQVQGDQVDIWTGSQAPTGFRDAVMELSGLSADQVHIHTTLLGGGFGRRSELDVVRLAYRIAAQAAGKPVKLIWTREEDIRHDFYRPAAIARFRGLMGEKKPLAFDARIASQSIMASIAKRQPMPVFGPDPTVVEGTAGQPDGIENFRVRSYTPELVVPVGFWRSVGASFNGFIHESFMDELAASKGVDPVAMRLEMVSELSPVAVGVIQKVAEMAKWQGGKSGTAQGRGFAYTLSFGAHTAQIVDVSVVDGRVKVDKVYCAVDVGTALDPNNIVAQIESGIIFGLTSAIHGEVTVRDGAVVQSNFHDYPVMRLAQVPEIEVAILENNPVITGVGEPGTPPAPPALANAIFAATGQRIRELPMKKYIKFL